MTKGLLPAPRHTYCRPLNGMKLLENGEMEHHNGLFSRAYQPHLRQLAKDLYKVRNGAAQATACANTLLSMNMTSSDSAPRKVLLDSSTLTFSGM